MPLVIACDIVAVVCVVSLLISVVICLCIRRHLALRETWFSSPTLHEDDWDIEPIHHAVSLVLASWAFVLIGLNIAFIGLWIVHLVHTIRDGETTELISQLIFGASRVATLNASVRSFDHLLKSQCATTETEYEAAHRTARLFMLDGVYIPLLVLAYGGQAVDAVFDLACGIQSIGWACGVMVSLRESQRAANLISEDRTTTDAATTAPTCRSSTILSISLVAIPQRAAEV
ncbi:hypothetical protein AURDEDRAFT_158233 [Auricularia subglabra TFB-10046 SS5]|nr:hypothetical protein AURDEDRAFT_158233 [Auricularia subglabra TFB-10046 SS5]